MTANHAFAGFFDYVPTPFNPIPKAVQDVLPEPVRKAQEYIPSVSNPIPKPPIPLPVPPVTIPGCTVCPCLGLEKCREDVNKEIKKVGDKVTQEVEKQGSKVSKEIEKAAASAITIAKDKIKDAGEYAKKNLKNYEDLIRKQIRVIETAANDPHFFDHALQYGAQLVQNQIDFERERFTDLIDFMIKNDLKRKIREHQVLIVVSELERWASQSPKLYGFLQSSGVTMTKSILNDWYSEIIVLEKSQATQAGLLEAIKRATSRDEIKAVDVFVFLHGAPHSLAFYEGEVPSNQLGDEIARIDTKGKLRMLYSTACFGSTHNLDFRRAGFRVVDGAIAVNANGVSELPAFLQSLNTGLPYGIAIATGNIPAVNDSWDTSLKAFSQEPVNSTKVVDGDQSLSFITSGARWVLNGVIGQ